MIYHRHTLVDYKMSTDYKKLRKELINGKHIVGFYRPSSKSELWEIDVFYYVENMNGSPMCGWIKDNEFSDVNTFCGICKEYDVKFIDNDKKRNT